MRKVLVFLLLASCGDDAKQTPETTVAPDTIEETTVAPETVEDTIEETTVAPETIEDTIAETTVAPETIEDTVVDEPEVEVEPETVEEIADDIEVEVAEPPPDRDDDGVPDDIEIALGSNPDDRDDTPTTHGITWFLAPYLGEPAEPQMVSLKAEHLRTDVAVVVDCNPTMVDEITNIQVGIQGLRNELFDLPGAALGVAGFQDYPVEPYGVPSESQAYFTTTFGFMSTGIADNFAGLAGLREDDGGDVATSAVAALQRAFTDEELAWPNSALPPYGTTAERYGSLRFRRGALPIMVFVADGPFHNGRRVSTPAALHDTYSFSTPTVDTLASVMSASGVRFAAVSSADGVRSGGDPFEDLAWLVDAIGAYGEAADNGSCKTGLGGAAVTADGPNGTCRLVFDLAKNGSGTTAAIDAAAHAAYATTRLDVEATASDRDADGAAAAFVDALTIDHNDVPLGATVEISITPRANDVMVANDTVRVFWVRITLGARIAGTDVALDLVPAMREVAFVVPVRP